METYQWVVFQHCNAFPNELFSLFQGSLSARICLFTHMKWNEFLARCCIWASDLSRVWYCETSIRSFVGKLDKDLGCIIPCHAIPCYMRYASPVTASQLVHRSTIGAMTGKAWNQGYRMGVTRDCRMNKKGCFPQNVGYDGSAVAFCRQTLVRKHCPTQDVGVGKWLSMKPCNKLYHRTQESAKHWL